MTYVVNQGKPDEQTVEADFYNYWSEKPYVTFWRRLSGRDVAVFTVRVRKSTTIRPA